MPRRSVAFFFFVLMLLQPLGKLGILIGYELNKDFITQNLCENRSKPQSSCHGKCHLRKQLEKHDKQENGSSQIPQVKAEISVYTSESIGFDFASNASTISFSFIYSASSSEKHLRLPEHPPSC